MSKRRKKPAQAGTIAANRDTPREFRFVSAVGITAASGEAKLPTFEGCAYTGAPMKPEMWWHPVIVDLAGVKIPSQHRPALRQHDHEQIVGHTTSVKADQDGIQVAGAFSGEAQHVDKVVVPARNGFQWQLSIGANPVRSEFLEAGEETTVNGRTVTGPMTISRETEIGEISFVPLGADGDTSATVAAQRGNPMNPFQITLKTLMAELRAAGQASATTYSDEQIDKMSVDEARAAVRQCMTAADDDSETSETDDSKKTDAKAQTAALKAEAAAVMADLRKNAAAEHQRQGAITAAVRRHQVTECEVEEKGVKTKVDLVAHAIEHNWTADAAELAAIRAARPGPGVGIPGGLGYSVSNPDMSEAVLEAAVLHAARHEFRLEDDSFYFSQEGDFKYRRVPEYIQRDAQRDLKARYTDQVQQAAHTAFRGRIGLQQLIIAAARCNGYQGRDAKIDDLNGPEILRFAAGPRFAGPVHGIRAEGASTASIANIVANVMNKFMLQGYLFTEQAWREVAAIRPVNDFKPTKSINLLGDVMFAQVPATGELIDASLSDQAFANQADQFGRLLTINRKNLINDDQGILSTAPMKIGQGGGLKLDHLHWTAFLALATTTADDGNPFWNSSAGTHGAPPPFQVAAGPNYFSGAGSALSSASLQTAKQLFDKQVDPNGNPLGFDGLTPNLLFPPELWMTAIELVDPSAIGLVYGGATASKQPNLNAWKGRLKPVMSRYLSNPNFAGSSPTAWYALFNPVALAVIEVCFLGGVDVPTVQMASQDFQFDRLGMTLRGILDVGVNAQNFRGGVKSAGA